MSAFKIRISEIKKEPEQIKSTARQIPFFCNDLGRVSSHLHYISGSFDKISGALNEIKKQLERNSENLNDLGTSLETIIQIYLKTEKEIVSAEGRIGEHHKSGKKADSIADNINNDSIWGKDNKYVYVTAAGNNWVFHRGSQNPARPDFDNGYPYDPNMKPTLSDYLNYAKWGIICEGADVLDYLPDGVRAYNYYRNGDGSPLEIDFAKGYKQDSVIRDNTDRIVAETNRAIQQMIKKGEKPPFSITSECISAGSYPCTENWQKTIGGYQVWISADINYDEHGNVVVNTTVHEWDCYNFNKGEVDIATGEPDDVNGRFEALGWAHSFDTYGSIGFQTVITPDEQIGIPELTTSGERNRIGYEKRSYR